jgi:hypothetical protein
MGFYPFSGSTVTAPVIDKGGQEFNVKAYGAKCNGQAGYTGQATNGSATFTDPAAAFTSALIGQTFTMLSNSVGTVWTGTINAVPSATTLTISTTAPFSSQLASSATGSITSGANNLTDAGGAFNAAWDGAIVTIQGAGAAGAVLTGMLQAVASTTSLFLCAVNNTSSPVNAGTTLTGTASYTINYGQYIIGSDDTAAWNLAILAASAGLAPKRIYWTGVSHVNTMLTIPQNVALVSDNVSATNPIVSKPVNGGVLRAHGTFTGAAVVTFGPGTSGYLETQVSASASWCTIDAGGMVAWAAIAAGNANYFDHVDFRSGTTGVMQAVGGTGQTIWEQCTAAGLGVGDALFIQQNDCQWYGGFLRSSVNQVHIRNCTDFKMIGAHLFSGFGDSNLAQGTNVLIDTTAGGAVSDVEFGNCDFDDVNGPVCNIVPAAATSITEINFVGCQHYQNASTIFTWPNNTWPVFQVNITAAGTTVSRLNVTGGSAVSNVGGSLYSALLAVVGSGGTLSVVNFVGMTATYCSTLQTGQAPTHPNYTGITIYNGSAFFNNPGRGQATFSGTGAQTAFVINHSMQVTPSTAIVTPAAAAAASLYSVAVSATQITVTFTVAPALGTNNVVLNWWASV